MRHLRFKCLKKSTKRICKIVVLMFFLLMPLMTIKALAAGADSSKFMYYRDINFQGEGFQTFTLTPEIYNRCALDTPDLRIFDSKSQEVPYQKYDKFPLTNPHLANVNFSILNRSKVGNSIHATFMKDKSVELYGELFIEVDSIDYLMVPILYGSEDGKEYVKIETSGYIYAFDDAKKGNNKSVRFDKVNYKFLKAELNIVAGDPKLSPKAMKKVYTVEKSEMSPPMVPIKSKILGNTVQGKVSILDLDLGYDSLPISKVDVRVKESDFIRSVDLAFSQPNHNMQTYQTFATGTLARYNVGSYKVDKTTLEFNRTSGRILRLTFHNNDNQGLNILGVDVYHQPDDILFKAVKGEKYRIYYGSRAYLAQPLYDISYMTENLDTTKLLKLSLSGEVKNPDYKEKDVPLPERSKWFVNLSIAIIVLSLGALLFKNLKSAV